MHCIFTSGYDSVYYTITLHSNSDSILSFRLKWLFGWAKALLGFSSPAGEGSKWTVGEGLFLRATDSAFP